MVVYALAAISPFPITDICMSHLFPLSIFFSVWPNRKTVHVCTFCTCVHPFLAPCFAYANRHVSCCGLCLQALLLTADSWRAAVSNVTVLTRCGFGGGLGVTSPPTSTPEGNLMKSGLRLCCRKLQHMLAVLSTQPAQWLLPSLNEMRQLADTCNTSALIVQRVPRSFAPPGSTMQFTPKSCFCERLHKKVFMSSCATE